MNQYSQQPVQPYQGGQQSFQNQNRYQPSGFVHSNYQGQLSQPTFGQSTGSIVGPPSAGYGFQSSQQHSYQHHAAPAYQASSHMPAVSNHSFIPHQPLQSYASSPAAAIGNVGPVIAHVGYQAGPSQTQYGQRTYYQPTQSAYNANAQQHMSSHTEGYHSQAGHSYGMSQVHSNTPHNPVYKATHAYEQAGPVISQLGWQAGSSN